MKKEIVDKSIEVDSIVYDGDTIADVIKRIKDLENEIFPYHTRHEFNKTYYDYFEAPDLYLMLYRLETDEEYNQRLEEERMQQERSEKIRLKKLEIKLAKQKREEELERAEYERLKAKYGNS